MKDNKNILIAIAVVTLVWAGCLYHTTTINALQKKYEKTCASSVKKSEKISQLVRELNNERQTSRVYYQRFMFGGNSCRQYIWCLGIISNDGNVSSMRKFNAIKNAVNFGKGTSMAQKRRTERLKKETIQVGDKVQWIGFRGDTEIVLKGVVESVGEFNGVKTFTVRLFADQTQTMVTASRVSKIQERFYYEYVVQPVDRFGFIVCCYWYHVGYFGVLKMSDRLYEFIVTGICVSTIVAGAIFGTWALLVTMSW